MGRIEDAWYVHYSNDCTLMRGDTKILDIYDPKEMLVWTGE